jgi:branched-chain amino acid transport system substrate-binding protein
MFCSVCSCRSRKDLLIAAAAALVVAMLSGAVCAQRAEAIEIRDSMSLTVGLAADARSALLGQYNWAEVKNAKGGILGRPVTLVYYDGKTLASKIPPIYTKLLELKKVDAIIDPNGSVPTVPATPLIMQRKKRFVGLLAPAVNSEFENSNYFVNDPVWIGRQSGLAKASLMRAFRKIQAAARGHCGGRPGILTQCGEWRPQRT